jgi:hypothetical protein
MVKHIAIQAKSCPRQQSLFGKLQIIDIQTAINLISSTTTKTHLKVICVEGTNHYELSKKVSDEAFHAITLVKISPLEEWNHIINPRQSIKHTIFSVINRAYLHLPISNGAIVAGNFDLAALGYYLTVP